MAQIYRDAFGIPHVRATSVNDLAFGQGEVTARDRSWQLEWLRRRAIGETAAILGDSALSWDEFAQRTQLVDTAQRAFERLSEETRDFVVSYVDGVNLGLDEAWELTALGISAEPWPEWMPLATFHAQHVLFAGLGTHLWQQRVREVLGDDAALLGRNAPTASGSNAWAVGGRRTASGMPLIGGDPHRNIEAPGVYQQIRLACPEFDVVGFAFPGVPGTPHFAHAGDVAWAITNACADYQDVYRADGPREAHDLEVEPGLWMRYAPTVLGDLGFEALLPLLRARTVDDVDAALDHWVEPVNNVVIADRHGALRYRIAGKVPTRDAVGAWTGWLADQHRVELPDDGQVVTANERRGPESAEIGSEFAAPFRADRITTLLQGRNDLTGADFAAIHNDTWLALVPKLGALVPGEFDDFDALMVADSVEAGRFAAWRSALVRRIAAEPVFDDLRTTTHSPLLAPWLDLTYRVALALPTLAGHERPLGIDLPALAQAALVDVRDQAGAWGDTHILTPIHAFDVAALGRPEIWAAPLDGDSECVRCTGAYPAQTDACVRGSVARYVWDLADRERSAWVVPLGASGDLEGTHGQDQLEAWVNGDLVPVVTAWDQLQLES